MVVEEDKGWLLRGDLVFFLRLYCSWSFLVGEDIKNVCREFYKIRKYKIEYIVRLMKVRV